MAKIQSRVQPRAEVEDEAEVEIETEEETETKAEAAVVVRPALAKLMLGWKSALGKADSYYPIIIWFVITNDVGRKEVQAALKEHRGMEKGAALNNAVSHIMRLKKHPDEVQACKDHEINPDTGNEWTVRELLKVGVTEREGKEEKTNDQKLYILLTKTAKFAIVEVKMKLQPFLAQCKSAYMEEAAAKEGEKVRTKAAAVKSEEPEPEEVEGEFEEAELEE